MEAAPVESEPTKGSGLHKMGYYANFWEEEMACSKISDIKRIGATKKIYFSYI